MANEVELRKVEGCANCIHSRGYWEGLWCGIHNEIAYVNPYNICDDYSADEPEIVKRKDD